MEGNFSCQIERWRGIRQLKRINRQTIDLISNFANEQID